jgi:hypothetical protein
MVYELLAGKKPFDGAPLEVARLNVMAEQPPIRERAPGVFVSREFERIIKKMLAKDRDQRYGSAREVIEALDQLAVVNGDPMMALLAGSQKSDSMPAMLQLPTGGMPVRAPLNPTPMTSVSALDVEAPERFTPAQKKAAIGAGATLVLALTVLAFARSSSPPAEVISLPVPTNQAGGSASPADPGTQADLHAAKLADDPAVHREAPAEAVPDPSKKEIVETSAETEAQEEAPDSPDTAAAPIERGDRGAASSRPPAPKRDPQRKPKARAAPAIASNPTPAPTSVPAAGDIRVDQLSRSYREVGSALDRFEQARGPKVAKPYQERYFAIPYSDAIRLPEMRREVLEQLNRLARDLKRDSR